jgi:hypothetical protein
MTQSFVRKSRQNALKISVYTTLGWIVHANADR